MDSLPLFPQVPLPTPLSAPLVPQSPSSNLNSGTLPLPTSEIVPSRFNSSVDPRFANKRVNRFKSNDNNETVAPIASFTPDDPAQRDASTLMQGDMREKEEMNRGFGATANQGIEEFGNIFTNNTL